MFKVTEIRDSKRRPSDHPDFKGDRIDTYEVSDNDIKTSIEDGTFLMMIRGGVKVIIERIGD